MDGKTLLVTGATGGIGEAFVDYACEQGARVVAVGRNQAKLNELAARWEGKILTCPADLTQTDAIEKVFSYCRQQKILLDGIVHAAGITRNCPLRTNNMRENEELMRINLEAFAEICRMASSRRNVKEGAAIVAVSSTAGLHSAKGIAIYGASKAALNSLVKSAAEELVSRKIRVNAVAPAMVRTRMYYEKLRILGEEEQDIYKTQPLGVIEPEDVADSIGFLLSDKARLITGTILHIGAGMID